MFRYVIAGNPVEHSQSPFIHARFAEQTGQPVAYDRLLCPLDAFAPTIQAFADGGGSGCNITVPFKFDAFAMAKRTSERAALAEAANVLRFDTDGWYADNTDGIGLVRDIERNAGIPLAGKRVLLVGAGGASSGALGPLLQAGPAELVLANRTVAKAQTLVDRHAAVAAASGTHLVARGLDEPGTAFDVVINASASSMAGAGIPVSSAVLKPGTLALDMMYGPAARGFIDWATSFGAVGRDGIGMLVEQAGEAFFVWRGIRPDTAPVLKALREKVDAK
ncbi:shikimate dehydrogenase [Piscinibacter gummiphilus]|uniref:Shikimate dehydrogenase (NADP(+)) n=1 Tax=Piscinibacter gummiphilus TaxID=946333 RepID=A0A1W6LEP4_9BURK|nr:shikimate dehydrogenase [Piscinibacter gummiphilus]ARN22731.1 shikimate dehydrogenase [Piscinibacter gummiphilus]ATU67428.1 shikimate dehydrogenase [Piscinibacter gummiphilus]GLS97787.1 shikimate dehydrogenase (NADP(+)) [Piscinibacter gummiphilus]